MPHTLFLMLSDPSEAPHDIPQVEEVQHPSAELMPVGAILLYGCHVT